MLATIAERGEAKSKQGRKVIKEYIRPFKEDNINKIILGCTHNIMNVDVEINQLEKTLTYI